MGCEMNKIELKEGDIVQLKPTHQFGSMLVVVTEPKEWGCQGYLMSPHDFNAVKYRGMAFVRPTFEDFEYVGRMHWIYDNKENDE
jgi:hypothetical protein